MSKANPNPDLLEENTRLRALGYVLRTIRVDYEPRTARLLVGGVWRRRSGHRASVVLSTAVTRGSAGRLIAGLFAAVGD